MLRPRQPALFDLASLPRPVLLAQRARSLALIANAACVETARRVAQVVTHGWWEASVRAAGGDPVRLRPPDRVPPAVTLPDRIVAEAQEFGRDLAMLPPAEAGDLIGRLYARALPAAHRSANGVFYTPSVLVRRLLNKAEHAGHDWARDRAIDPSCGAGAFLVEAAERMIAALRGANPAIVLTNLASRLRGWEIDPFAAWLAQVAVEVVALEQTLAAGRRLGPITEVHDALADFAAATGRWDLVMGNPPFGKVKDTPTLRGRFRRSLYGHPNLYGLFTDLAVHLARPDGGIVAYLTPASFLAGDYFKRLRRLLRDYAPPVSIDLVNSRTDAFEDVLQEVALSAFKRGGAAGPAACAVLSVTSSGMLDEATGTLVLPADPDAPWTLPRSADDMQLVERLHNMPTRLADWGYEVSTGPLVWNRHKLRLHDEPKPGRVPVVWAEAVTPDGRFVLKATRRKHRAWFEPRGPDDPNLVDRPCVLVQRTTAKEQHRRLICAEMPASTFTRFKRVAVENHLNMVRPIGRKPMVPLRVVAAFLATDTADRILRCINASVAVSASELNAMPLPTAEQIIDAMHEMDVEVSVQSIYGLRSR
jgi:adenine-specific DNA-methyltransferase